jgi:hypothetical protein
VAKNKQPPKSPRQKRLEKTLRKAQMPVAVGRILIVCEGEKTEPNYFKWYQTELQQLKSVSGRIRVRTAEEVYVDIMRIGDEIKINGAGRNTESLVTYTLKKLEDSVIDYTEVWCVFDRDSFPAQSYHRAIQLAHQNGLKVAYTNEAFELWYLLHYDYHDSALSRTQYQKKLSTRLGKPYQKNSTTMHEDLQQTGGDQQVAINYAKRLLKKYGDRTDYADQNPSTTVHLLVEALDKFLEDFRKKVNKFQ